MRKFRPTLWIKKKKPKSPGQKNNNNKNLKSGKQLTAKLKFWDPKWRQETDL
jgi:hypothetical protein